MKAMTFAPCGSTFPILRGVYGLSHHFAPLFTTVPYQFDTSTGIPLGLKAYFAKIAKKMRAGQMPGLHRLQLLTEK
ncbi:MAG TPA: hypothetical protein VGK74_12190 [Symbiobacteriaceae bacterium]|jgi:hypothetical protein